MGLTKSEKFTDEQNRIAALAKVIAHPARVAIIQHLLNEKSCICGEIVDKIGLSQPTISQHLREMRDVGLIQGTIEGTKTCYCLSPAGFNEMAQTLCSLFGQKFLKKNSSCC
ncbi:metalloregulator ArsR/SmtB family transcription factor [Chitinophagales bacterium]|nr:metalloregulator ArsR/SmtB family transcription factor [Chitinophagales bacterium]